MPWANRRRESRDRVGRARAGHRTGAGHGEQRQGRESKGWQGEQWRGRETKGRSRRAWVGQDRGRRFKTGQDVGIRDRVTRAGARRIE